MKFKIYFKRILLILIIFILAVLILLSFLAINYCIITTHEKYISVTTNDWVEVASVDISNTQDQDIIGYISIPSLKNSYYIDMPIKDGTDLNTLATAIGHFKGTPYENGNICLAGHNSGSNSNGNYVGFFDSISELTNGDLIYYKTVNDNTYQAYEVFENQIIEETDLSVLENSNNNILTLITCVNGTSNRKYRICVVARRIGDTL